MNGLEDWRDSARVPISGKAVWSGRRVEGCSEIRDLSLGGTGIFEPSCPLQVGTRLTVALLLGAETIEPIRAEVVRTGVRDLALRFLQLSGEQRARIGVLLGLAFEGV